MTRNTCGLCEHALKVVNPNSIGDNTLTCHVLPPQMMAIASHNNASVICGRPQVRPEDPCCSLFAPKVKTIV